MKTHDWLTNKGDCAAHREVAPQASLPQLNDIYLVIVGVCIGVCVVAITLLVFLLWPCYSRASCFICGSRVPSWPVSRTYCHRCWNSRTTRTLQVYTMRSLCQFATYRRTPDDILISHLVWRLYSEFGLLFQYKQMTDGFIVVELVFPDTPIVPLDSLVAGLHGSHGAYLAPILYSRRLAPGGDRKANLGLVFAYAPQFEYKTYFYARWWSFQTMLVRSLAMVHMWSPTYMRHDREGIPQMASERAVVYGLKLIFKPCPACISPQFNRPQPLRKCPYCNFCEHENRGQAAKLGFAGFCCHTCMWSQGALHGTRCHGVTTSQ